MNKRLKYALIGSLIAFSAINIKNKSAFDFNIKNNSVYERFFPKKSVENEKPCISTLSFREALELYPKETKTSLLDNVIKTNSNSSIDSVIKFVPKEYIENYLETFKSSVIEDPAHNRLRTLTLSGDDVARERFSYSKNSISSLRAYARTLGVVPSEFGSNRELRHFLNLYKDGM